MKVILSHPYSSALYWWFTELNGDPLAQDDDIQHPYYRALYREAKSNIDIALTSVLVFDEIELPGVDAHFPPGHEKGGDSVEELGLRMDWEPVSLAQQLISKHRQELAHDHGLSRVLEDACEPGRPEEHQHELLYAITDIFMAAEHGAPVVCSSGRHGVISRVLELEFLADGPDALPVSEAAGLFRENLSADLAQYTELAGLRLRRDNLDRLAGLREDAAIRAYGAGFQEHLLEDRDAWEGDLIDRLSDAADAADAQRQLTGLFAATSRTASVAGLIPGLGTAATIGGLGADAAAARSEKKVPRIAWHEFGPTVLKAQSMAELTEVMTRRKRELRGRHRAE